MAYGLFLMHYDSELHVDYKFNSSAVKVSANSFGYFFYTDLKQMPHPLQFYSDCILNLVTAN